MHTIALFLTNPVDRRLLTDFLRQLGHESHFPTPSKTSLENLGEFSLIITDTTAARAYGKRLMDLKWQAGSLFSPILITLPHKAESLSWLRAGFDDILRLPITKAELAARLSVFLRLRERSGEHYRDVFENALIGIYRTTPDGRVLLANPTLVQMLGYNSFEELARDNFEDTLIGSSDIGATFKERLEDEGQIIGVEAGWIRRDGTTLFVRQSARAVRDEAGKTLYYIGTLEDITERKQLEEQRAQLLAREQAARAEAETASRAKDDFLAVLSHELRTPLTSMLGWTRMLRTGMVDEATCARAFETLERNTQALAQIIEDILDVSRIITGKLRLETRPLELIPVIQAAIDSLRPAAEVNGIQITALLTKAPGLVQADPTRIQQVVWNLLANAVKFTPEGGHIDVQLEEVDRQMEIKVSDTGRGISAKFLPFVFDRFRQADSPITRGYGGLGLGLALARHLVELHGGTIQAESRGEGQGATFIVRLPVISAEVKGRSPKPLATLAEDAALKVRGVKVLMVDDDTDTLAVITTVLEQAGVEVTAVTSAAEALLLIEQQRPDVVISDIAMPGEDGYQLVKKIKAIEGKRGWRVPCVALTAFAGKEDRMRALSSGFQMHIPKPVELDEILAVIANLTGRTE